MNEAETRRSPSVDGGEVARFEALAGDWWGDAGKFKGLHAFNPARLEFIVGNAIVDRPERKPEVLSLAGKTVLDIGCGGGILSEPLARLGARVTGIDPVAAAIAVANKHALQQGLSIDYRAATAETLAAEGRTFDLVVASEVIEHVADVASFLSTCRLLTKDGGALVISTLNRTAKSYALAIVAAENLLGLIPKGTHEWRKFIKPPELEAALAAARFSPGPKSGIVFDPLRQSWKLSPTDLSVNYIVAAEAAR